MQLKLKNTKDSKDINYFMHAVRQLNVFSSKEGGKSFSMTVHGDSLLLSSVCNQEPLSCYSYQICEYTFNKQHFRYVNRENLAGLKWLVRFYHLTKFINPKLDKKINALDISLQQDEDEEYLMNVQYIDEEYMQGAIQLKVQLDSTPYRPLPLDSENIRCVPVAIFPDNFTKLFQFSAQNLWIEFAHDGLNFFNTRNNRTISQKLLNASHLNNYDSIRLKQSLRNKVFMSLIDDKFIFHLAESAKYKRKTKASIILVMERDQDTEIRLSFFLLESQHPWGKCQTIVSCFLGTSIKNTETQEVVYKSHRETGENKNTLLKAKAEENVESLRKAVLNRTYGLQNQAENTDRIKYEKRSAGKIQEKQQTCTKTHKFQF